MDNPQNATDNYLTQKEIHHLCRSGNLMALDLGQRKVGVAIGSIELQIATPLVVLEYANTAHLAAQLRSLVFEYRVVGMVIGAARIDEEYTSALKSFINNLGLSLPFCFEDETYTTKIANDTLSALGMKRKKRHQIDDKVAAQIILSSFFAKNHL